MPVPEPVLPDELVPEVVLPVAPVFPPVPPVLPDTPEPLPEGHRMWTTPNVIISPHPSVDDPSSYTPLSLDLFFEEDALGGDQTGREGGHRRLLGTGFEHARLLEHRLDPAHVEERLLRHIVEVTVDEDFE